MTNRNNSFRLGPKKSNIVLVLFIITTLLARLFIETELNGNLILSLAIGIVCLGVIYMFIKYDILNPTIMNINKKEENSDPPMYI